MRLTKTGIILILLSLVISGTHFILKSNSGTQRLFPPYDVDLTLPTNSEMHIYNGVLYRQFMPDSTPFQIKNTRTLIQFSNTDNTLRFTTGQYGRQSQPYTYIIDGNQIIILNSKHRFTTNGKQITCNKTGTIFAPALDFIRKSN